MRRPLLCVVTLGILFLSNVFVPGLRAQDSPSSQLVQVIPPMRRAEPPAPTASLNDLITRGDELRAEKDYLDSLDYYRAALVKAPKDASIYNRMGIAEMQLERWRDSEKQFESAIRVDPTFADAYNNLGVDYYEVRKYGKAIKEYEAAIRLRNDSSSFYSNLGAAYFSKKDFEKAIAAYARALDLDPDIFDHSSRTGVEARLPSPEDRAHYHYVMAKLYAKAGAMDRSLENLRRAMEEGYKGIGDVYKDSEFAQLRKDPRFTQLMAAPPTVIPE